MSNPEAWADLGQVRHWLWTVERELDRLETLRFKGMRLVSERGGYTKESGRVFSEESATEHWIVVAAHHLVKTLKSTHVPNEMREAFSPELVEQIEILRHLKEHEEEHRSGEWKEVRRAVRTRERHENRADGPLFSSRWSPQEGGKLDGILSLNDLREACARVETAMPEEDSRRSAESD